MNNVPKLRLKTGPQKTRVEFMLASRSFHVVESLRMS